MPAQPSRLGKVESQEHQERLATASRQLHRREARDGDILETSLETPLGRLSYHGKISRSEYEAGRRYAEISLRYLATIGSPYPFGDGDPPADLMPSDEECTQAKRDYDGAYKALFRSGNRPTSAVEDVAVYEQTLDEFNVRMARVGLKALADYFEGVSKILLFRRPA